MAKAVAVGPERIAALSEEARSKFPWVPRVRAVAEVPKERPRRVARMVSKDGLDWLVDLSQHPFRQTTVRDKMLGLSASRAKNARTELEELGFVRRHVVQSGKRGGQFVLEEITEAGYEHLAELQVPARKPAGKGGYAHKFWQHKVAEWLRDRYEGARVGIEDAGSGKSVDVSLFLPSQPAGAGKVIAYEVLVSGEEKELTNVREDLATGYDQVVMCVDSWERSERLKEKMGRGLRAAEVARVRFQLLSQFLE